MALIVVVRRGKEGEGGGKERGKTKGHRGQLLDTKPLLVAETTHTPSSPFPKVSTRIHSQNKQLHTNISYQVCRAKFFLRSQSSNTAVDDPTFLHTVEERKHQNARSDFQTQDATTKNNNQLRGAYQVYNFAKMYQSTGLTTHGSPPCPTAIFCGRPRRRRGRLIKLATRR